MAPAKSSAGSQGSGHSSPAYPTFGPRNLALAVLMLSVLAMLGSLSVSISRQIEILGSSSIDNVQWSLSQMDVELLTLEIAIGEVQDGVAPLSELRTRFDIAYSRYSTLKAGAVFSELRQSSSFDVAFAAIHNFMTRHVVVIDGPDERLRAALPELKSELRRLIPVAHRLGAVGVEIFARQADRVRTDVKSALVGLAFLSITLLVALLAMVGNLIRTIRIARARAAEAAETASRLDAVIRASLDPVITLDGAGQIVDFNPAAVRIFGHDREDVLGKPLTLLVPPGPDETPQIPLADLSAGPGLSRLRVTAHDARRREFPAEVSVSAVEADGAPMVVVFLSDLSQQVAAEQALVAARDAALAGEKAKADLLVVMSHELRTPLNGMIGTIDLMQETDLRPQQREYLRIMSTSGRLLMSHVNDILDMARLDSGRSSLTLAPVDLASLAGEVIENQFPASQAQGNALQLQIAPGCPTRVLADAVRMRQVLLNLVGNAVKFTKGGRITVDIGLPEPGGPFHIRVSDTGIGISPQNIGRIFDDFVTLDPSFARKSSGTGLGLGIVRRIVTQMGGEITVTSTPGVGSLFHMRLPLALDPSAQSLPAPPVPGGEDPVPTGLTLLVVEDNEFNRRIVRDMLRRDGHKVSEAHDGEEGVRRAMAEAFDLILMDISMPGLDGIDATARIRAEPGPNQSRPIVALTAHALPADAERFLAAGMQDVLMKPVQRVNLRRALNRHVPKALAPPPLPEEVLIDPEPLVQLGQGLGPAHLADLKRRFVTDISARLAKVSGECDIETMERELHHMAGSAGVFGARALASMLELLLDHLRADRVDQTRAALPDLQALWLRTRGAFQPGLTEPAAPSRDQASSLR